VGLRGIRTKLAIWLLPDSPYKETALAAYQGGWFSGQAKRLKEFCDAEMSKGGESKMGKITKLFCLIYGHEVKFSLVQGGLAKEHFNSSNPILERLKKNEQT